MSLFAVRAGSSPGPRGAGGSAPPRQATAGLRRLVAFVMLGERNAPRSLHAVETAERLEPDVIVLDARMPGADGFEAARRILARRPGTPILLCSAIVDDEIRARADAAGIAACVSKDHFDAIPAVALELAGR